MTRLDEALHGFRRKTTWLTLLFLLTAGLGISLQVERGDWVLVGVWLLLGLFWAGEVIRRLVSPRFRVPASDVAMVFDHTGATFYPIGQPSLQASWDDVGLETKWAPQQILFVRRGRTTLRFRIEWLEPGANDIAAAVERASGGQASMAVK